MDIVNHCGIVLMAFLTCVCTPHELSIQYSLRQVFICGSAPERVFCFRCRRMYSNSFMGSGLEDLIAGTFFEPVLTLMEIQCAEEVNSAGRRLSRVISLCVLNWRNTRCAGVLASWIGVFKVKSRLSSNYYNFKAAEELERAKQRLAIRRRPVTRESGNVGGEVAPVQASVSVHSASVGSDEKLGFLQSVEPRDMPYSEVSTGLVVKVILMESHFSIT